MKKALVLLIAICVICVSISGAAVSINNPINETVNTENEELVINQPTESPEVNTRLLNDINREVNKYLNFEEYIEGAAPPRKTLKEIEFPWQSGPLAAGDFVNWIIYVNYKEPDGEEKHFQEEIDINPRDFRDRFLEHPWHYEKVCFDTNEDGVDDLDIYYSVFLSQLANIPEGIDTKSVRTCLKVRTEDMLVRDAKLEVWSELKFNYGLIKDISRSRDLSIFSNSRIGRILNRFLENIKTRFENIGFTHLINILNRIFNKFLKNNAEKIEDPDFEVSQVDSDWLAMGIGVVSPENEIIPPYFEKYLNVAKENIFAPIIFEHELKQVGSREPLGLLFGFQAGHEGSSPTLDVAFEIDFDPAIHIRTQFIPRDGYIYYYYDIGSGHSQETRVTFTTNGFAENVELTLIFDNTHPIAHPGNWMSFDLDLLPPDIGFEYKANDEHDIGVLVTSPVFSAKLKLVDIPKRVRCWFDATLDFVYQQGQLLDASATGSINVDMSSNMNDIILYYPELSADEPKIEFIKISSLPAKQKLEAHAHLKIQNGSMTTMMGEGHVLLDLSSNLGSTKVFYRKADPNDPDKLLAYIPQVPGYNKVGIKLELYMDLDDLTNPNNYVYGRAYRTSSGNLQEISGYLPGQTEPIISITDIPANAEGKGKIEWNKLKGYAYARRQSAGPPDPITINIDIGTFNIYNYLEIQDGHIDCDFHLAEEGYFGFDTANDMIGDTLIVTDTSTGNQLTIEAYKVSADNLWVDWDLDMNKTPIPIEELSLSGELSLFEDFTISATYQGKALQFEGNWKIGQEGEFSVDFSQDEPIELIVDDLFPDNPTWDIGGGVIISQDFHFDIKWKWEQGQNYDDPGYFLINEDTNDPNFDSIFIYITYDPSGSNNPKYGIEAGATNIGVIVYLKWWKHPTQWLPQVWWYVHITANFYLDLLWEGDWYENVHLW